MSVEMVRHDSADRTLRARTLAALLLVAAAVGACAGDKSTTARDAAAVQPNSLLAITPMTVAAPEAAATTTAITVGKSVWVSVSVATLWSSPTSPRPVDAKALTAPVDVRGWLAAMSTTVRRGLVGRVQTQALYGERLIVTSVSSGWLHVVATNQPTHKDRRGYPGWVPSRQVTTHAPTSTVSVATVTRMTSWLRTPSGARALEVSVGTRLPVLASSSGAVTVATPTGGRLLVSAGDVVVRAGTNPALPRTSTSALASARTFLGRPYLWGGRSGFAVDCSGFTELAFALHGVVIPRDTDDQAAAGTAARLTSLRVADLVLFRSAGAFTHVGIYAGNGMMLHSPRTGSFVQLSPVGAIAIARRIL